MGRPASYKKADSCSDCAYFCEYTYRCKYHNFTTTGDGWCADYNWDL